MQPSEARPEINKETLFECSSPRKSLVKGERFVRSEEKPELLSCGFSSFHNYDSYILRVMTNY